MYLRLTTRCNMKCAHCCFSCNTRGKDMSREVLDAALKINRDHSDTISLGGGEPTLHPQFWEFLAAAVVQSDTEIPPFVATNGSITETALGLAKLAKKGIVQAALSQDPWHSSIDGRVIQAFTKQNSFGLPYNRDPDDCREIRNVEHNVFSIGRARKNGLGVRVGCLCDSLTVEPDGRIWLCACRKEQLGTVFKPEIPDSYWSWDQLRCSRTMKAA